jgi:membrane-associated phospholipid phosphatase
MIKQLLLSTLLLLSYAQASCAGDQDAIQRAGDIGKYVLPFSAAAVTLWHSDYEGTYQLALVQASSQLLSEGLKRVVTEYRPNRSSTVSFPSGHAIAGFSAATFLWRRYGPEYGIPAMLGGGFIAFSRIHARRHHFHDVYASFVFGSAMTLLFTKPFMIGKAKIQPTPLIGKESVGVHLALTL